MGKQPSEDLLTRVRRDYIQDGCDCARCKDWQQAADEIERLKGELAHWQYLCETNQPTLDEKDAEIERLKPFERAIKTRHNGYNEEVRKECPNFKEPSTPELVKEVWTLQGDKEALQSHIAKPLP